MSFLTWMMDEVKGFVMTLRRSGAFSPVWMLKDSIIRWVSLYRSPVATSSGRRMRIDSQLKKSWTVAPANALEVRQKSEFLTCYHHTFIPHLFLTVTFTYLPNSFLSPACIIATIVLVTDVPMLAPMTIGTADLTSSTGKRNKKKRQRCVSSWLVQ